MTASYQHYATHDESEFPHLWEGVVGAWAPCLGPSGTRLHDHSGRANWGTLTNMDAATDWVVDGGQYALDFDGSNDFVDFFSPTTGAHPLTISAWAKQSANTADRHVIKFGTATLNNAFGIYRNAAANAIVAGLHANSVSEAILTGTFTNLFHVAATLTPDAVTITFNGQTTVTRSGTFSYSIGSTFGRIGSAQSGLVPWNGLIWEAVVWTRALNANEIRELYEIGRGGMYTPRRRRRAYSFGPSFQAVWARGSNVILQPCGVS